MAIVEKNAIVTICNDASYLPGACVLAEQFAKCCKTPFFVVVPETSHVILRFLRNYGIPYIITENADIPQNTKDTLISCGMGHWANTFFKFRVWGLTQFNKILVVDSDVMLIKQRAAIFDSVFDMEPFCALDLGLFLHEKVARHIPIAGLMLIRPDLNVEHRLWNILSLRSSAGDRIDGDEPIIKACFPSIDDAHILPPSLQCDFGLVDRTRNLSFSSVHFPGKQKPWMKSGWRILRDTASFFVHRRLRCASILLRYRISLRKWIKRLIRFPYKD